MSQPQVGIMMGSKSDLEIMKAAAAILDDFGITYEMKVLSAHRTPVECVEFVEKISNEGGKAFICGAGLSAALPGVVAAHTLLPVIGIPLDAGTLGGMDALLSVAQMPPGVPVGCVAIGKVGAKNAGLLVARILGLSDDMITKKLEKFRDDQKEQILNTEL
ncbi:MAG: phosphoribosylaminoimidazole carboxylase PurE protein [Lysobacterales bacterium]|jgi:phosphoribosylaminoimidazole carboxylase PurE protein